MPNSKSAPCAVPVCPSSSRRVATHADFLEALDSFHADLIIADYNLPDIDGLTAVRLVRQRDSALPVLLVTGVLDDEAAAAVVKAGATDYVRKDRLARLPLAVEGALAAATTQRVLQQSQREIADLYNNAPCGYHSTTRDLTIVSMNDTELAWLGYRRDEVVGKLRIVDLLTPSSATKIVQEAFPRLLATGSVRDVELDMVCKDGAILPTLFSATSVTDPDGSFVRSRTTVYDTSRLKEAEQRERNLRAELDQSRRLEALGQLTAGVAHDFNNLLQGIMANLELVDDDIGVPPATLEYVASAVRLAEQAGELTHNLLSCARKQLLSPNEVALGDFLNQFQRLLSHTLDPRIKVDLVTEPILAPVWVDPKFLQTALLNLALNARDAMPSGGNLTIEAAGDPAAAADNWAGSDTQAAGFPRKGDGRRDRCAVIRVRDTGTGISPENLARVCEPFFTTKGLKGTGLGLSMVYGFVKQSGGEMRITSGLGKGTCVEVRLPLMDAKVTPTELRQ